MVYIPQSLIGPIRALTNNHYYVRIGSDFGFVTHDVLAGMFGRAPQPNADLNLISHPARLDSKPGHLTIAFGLVAVNLGIVVGERPYISVFFGDLAQDQLIVLATDRQNFSVRRGPISNFSVMLSAGFLLAPSASEHMCDVVIELPVAAPRAIKLDCTLGVLGAPPKRFTLEASEEAVRAGILRAGSGHVTSSEILTLRPDA